MERAQKETYGDGLDEQYLQKFHVAVETTLLRAGSLVLQLSLRIRLFVRNRAGMRSTNNAANHSWRITKTCCHPPVKRRPPTLPTLRHDITKRKFLG